MEIDSGRDLDPFNLGDQTDQILNQEDPPPEEEEEEEDYDDPLHEEDESTGEGNHKRRGEDTNCEDEPPINQRWHGEEELPRQGQIQELEDEDNEEEIELHSSSEGEEDDGSQDNDEFGEVDNDEAEEIDPTYDPNRRTLTMWDHEYWENRGRQEREKKLEKI